MYQPQIYNNFTPSYFPKEIIINSEKATIKKTARLISIPFLCVMILMGLWTYPYYWIMSFFGFSELDAQGLLADPGIIQVVGVVLSLSFFTIPFAITAYSSGYKISSLIPFNAPQKGLTFPFLLIGISVCSFANIGVSIAGGIFESFGFEYGFSYGDDPKGMFGLLLSVISTAIVPALAEEFACRGIVHGLLSRFGEGFALVMTAILFGAMHGNFQQIPFAFIVGLVLGYVRIKTGSIWVCVYIHFVNNFISVIFSRIDKIFPNTMSALLYSVYLCVALILGIIGIMLLKNWKGEFYKLNNSESICSEKQKYLWFLTSVPIIIFLSFCFLESLAFFK